MAVADDDRGAWEGQTPRALITWRELRKAAVWWWWARGIGKQDPEVQPGEWLTAILWRLCGFYVHRSAGFDRCYVVITYLLLADNGFNFTS